MSLSCSIKYCNIINSIKNLSSNVDTGINNVSNSNINDVKNKRNRKYLITLRTHKKTTYGISLFALMILLSSYFDFSNCLSSKSKLKTNSKTKMTTTEALDLENTLATSLNLNLDARSSNNNNDDKAVYANERVIINGNGVENPMIPVAAGIGGEVIVACSECRKLMTSFINRCVDQEAVGQQADTFRTFCESYRDKPTSHINPETCLILNAKLASVSGESGTEIIDPTKPPNECIRYRSHCNNFGGAPLCYTGFCEQIAECIDCPSALIDKNKDGDFVMEVCGMSGICRLGWKSPYSKGGNGYCECRNGMKGLSCNEY